MKYLFLVLCFGILTQSKSQSNDFGIISGNIGANIGINAIALEKTGVTAYPIIDEDVTAIMTNFPIELNFGLFKPISIGANFSPSRWSLIEGDIVSGQFSSWGLNVNLYPINKNRFNMQLSLTPSLLTFKTFSLEYDQNNKINIDLKGTAFKTRLLFNIYFSDNAGMYLNIGYSLYRIGINKYNLLLQDPDLETEINDLVNQGFNLILPGVQAGIGVVFKLNSSLSKKK